MVGGLRRRLFWVVTLIALVPLLGLSGMGYYTARREVGRSVRQNMQGLARLQALQLQDYFRQRKQQLAAMSAEVGRALHTRGAAAHAVKEMLKEQRRQKGYKTPAFVQTQAVGAVLKRLHLGNKVISLGVRNQSTGALRWTGAGPRPKKGARPPIVKMSVVGIFHFSKASETVLRLVSPLEKYGLAGFVLFVDFPFTVHQRFLQEKQAPAFRGDILLLDQTRKVMCGSFDLKHSHHLFGSQSSLPFDKEPQPWHRVHEYERGGKAMFGVAVPMGEVPWVLLIELPVGRAYQSLHALRTRGVVVLGLCVLFLLGLVAWSSDRVSKSQKRLTEEMIQREKMAAIGMLSTGVAHEIGNPLASIIALVERMQMMAEKEGVASRLVEVEERCQTIERILETMRDYARKKPEKEVPLDLAKELARAESLVRFDKRLQSIDVAREMSPNLPLLWGREDVLQQVFTNLLMNAIDALEGHESPQIKLRVWPTCDGVMCQVRDNGPGFGTDPASALFAPFATTKAEGKGTGLGLSVSEQLLAELGGTLEARREADETVMEIRLPTHKVTPPKAPAGGDNE